MATLSNMGFRLASDLRAGIVDLTRPGASNVPALDALRTLAILLVVSDHSRFFFVEATDHQSPLFRFPLFYFGWTGVDLFFVLSGYLIGKQLWRELRDTSTILVGRFLLRRGLRIWPYYFVFVAVIMAAMGTAPITAYLPDLVFLSNYVPARIAGGWSLSTEEQFYLFVPALLLATTRFIPFRHQWAPIFGLLCLLPVIRAVVLAQYGAHAHNDAALFYVIYTPFHTHADGLVAGLLLAWISVARPALIQTLHFWRNIRAPAILAAAGLALLAVDADLFAFTGLALVYGGFVLFFLRDRSVLSRFTGLRIFHVLSRLSYAMYLNHFVVMHWIPSIWLDASKYLSTTPAFLFGYAVALAISVAIASLTFIAIESPFLQFRDRWNKRHERVIPASRA